MGRNYHDTRFHWHGEQHQQLDFTVQQFDTSFRSLFPASYWVRNACCLCVWVFGRETDVWWLITHRSQCNVETFRSVSSCVQINILLHQWTLRRNAHSRPPCFLSAHSEMWFFLKTLLSPDLNITPLLHNIFLHFILFCKNVHLFLRKLWKKWGKQLLFIFCF